MGDGTKAVCDFCKREVAIWVDGKTVYGPWANMCLECYKVKGVGLGIGKGQLIEKGIVIKGGSTTGG